ncbi:hypothetical protein WJX82_001154 [Trebouxia sp. C0006]
MDDRSSPASSENTSGPDSFLKMDLEGTRSADLQQQLSEQACNVTDACATVNANKSEVKFNQMMLKGCQIGLTIAFLLVGATLPVAVPAAGALSPLVRVIMAASSAGAAAEIIDVTKSLGSSASMLQDTVGDHIAADAFLNNLQRLADSTKRSLVFADTAVSSQEPTAVALQSDTTVAASFPVDPVQRTFDML